MNTVNVYGCGGCGGKLTNEFVKRLAGNDITNKSLAKIKSYYIDTSASDLVGINPAADNVYLIEGMDGKGKLRAGDDVQRIADAVPKILHEFKPAKFNIIVHSASGGSGSILAPSLTNNILQTDNIVVILAVGSTGSTIEIDNTVKVLKGYDANSKRRNKPIIMRYFENSEETPELVVNNNVIEAMMLLAAAFSGTAAGLDFSDLRNLFSYQKVTSFPPELSYLDLIVGDIDVSRDTHPIAVLTLVDAITTDTSKAMVDYRAVGKVDDNTAAALGAVFPLRFVITSGHFQPIVDRLSALHSEYKNASSLAKQKPAIIAGTEELDNDGLMF